MTTTPAAPPHARPIRRLLVANRGEIARRVFATCRRLGIETVAVHSDADAGLPFVGEADAAVRLPGDAAADTYLRGDLLLAAARRTGADAVHPGYGFLSESADFARAVEAAGLTWVGPDPASIEAMGSKVEAKRRVGTAGVPVLADLDPASLGEADLPVLVKASAGGGGRGMRVVRDATQLAVLADTLAAAEAEAASAFGDGTVFVERYVEHGRHVEVQVVGDGRGRVAVLGDRDCSVQRRHQKVVEEAPAPGLPAEVRQALHDAARAAAEAMAYRGAGTVELLVATDPTGRCDRFFFLEMNTRLQVEHPVTECVTGLDLVELQIAVAEGTPLDELLPSGSVAARGHAVEVRLYAEDPDADHQPQAGRLSRFEVPDVAVELAGLPSYGIRLDSGVRSGDLVGTHYDALLAKVVCWAPTRAVALRRLAGVLRRTRVHGVRTNRDLLVEVLGHPAFVAGQVATDFLARHALPSRPGDDPGEAGALLAAAVACAEEAAARRGVQQGVPAGWRNVTSAPQRTAFLRPGGPVEVGWFGGRNGYRAAVAGRPGEMTARAARSDDGWSVTVDHDGLTRVHAVFLDDDRVDVETPTGHLALVRVPRFPDPTARSAPGSLLAALPGSVVDVRVSTGDAVTAGQPVLVLEAMKMQHTVTAPRDGVVTRLAVSAGQQVAAGAVLAVVTSLQPPQPPQPSPEPPSPDTSRPSGDQA